MSNKWIPLSICLTNIIADILCMILTRSWMIESGVIYLSEFHINCIKFSLTSFVILALLFEIIYVTDSNVFMYITMFISAVSILLYFIFGAQWIFDPKNVFNRYHSAWENNINKPQTTFIQVIFKCCGFYSVDEFPMDICKESKTKTCLHAISRAYENNVRITGFFAIMHVMSDFIIMMLLYITVFGQKMQKNHEPNMKKLEKNAQLMDSTYI